MTSAAKRQESTPPPMLRLVGAKPTRQLRPGIRFGETMRGQITLRATDPAAGYADPAAMGAVLHAQVYVDDVDSFIIDSRHRGRWTAVLEIPVLGGRFTAANGEFNLFQRTILPNRSPVREMVYDATVCHRDGVEYRLEGRKYVQPGAPWRAWGATTTLNVRLFDADNVLVACGQLKLSPTAFMRQLLSMRATGGVSLIEKPAVVWRFIRFFAGALVRSYLLGRRW